MNATIQNVLVTGGSGFVGSHIVQRLLEISTDANPIRVSAISRNPKNKIQGVTYHAADVTNEQEVEALIDEIKPQVIIHTVSPQALDTPALEPVNVNGTAILLRCAKACSSTQAFVYTSSDSACQFSIDRITENEVQLWDRKHYNNPYGKTKAIADAMVLAANCPELRTASLRIPAIYGEDDPHMIPQLLESVRKGEQVMQIGPNDHFFEFCYVRSVAEAHILAAQALLRASATPSISDPSQKVDGEAFFITDGISRKFFDFARDCYAAAGAPVAESEIKIIPFWLVKTMASVGEWVYYIFTLGTVKPKMRRQEIDHLGGGAYWSIEKARSRLGYEPVLEQYEAIKKSVEGCMKVAGMQATN